jgi:hypothetical protein
MKFLIGSVLTVALVLLLIAIWRPESSRLGELRGAAYMLLIGVPALVLQTDLFAITALVGGSMALFEVVVVMFA